MHYENYRLTIYPALEESNDSFSSTFATKELMVSGSHLAANLLLALQDSFGIMPDYSNNFIMEGFINGDWEEIEE